MMMMMTTTFDDDGDEKRKKNSSLFFLPSTKRTKIKIKPAPSARRPADSAPRLAIPSKGRMAEDTLQLLRDCQLSVFKPNPRQYVASIPQLPGVEVWFQRASDVVRKLSYGDVDLGIVGYDMFAEISGAAMVGGGANGNANGDGKNPSDLIHGDLVVLHDALGFGGCHLGLGVPAGEGRFADVDSLDDLLSMPDWTPETPLRVVTGYQNVARAFFESKGFSDRVALLGADGALEAAPLMGCADIILDLVSTGVTLRENNLKEIEGGTVLKSQGVLVANRHALLRDGGRLLDIVHELIERLEAHLKADNYYSVVANMRGPTSRAVADRILACDGLGGLEGPTVSPVFAPQKDGKKSHSKAPTPNGDDDELELDDEGNDGLWAAVICVPKRRLYDSVKELRAIGGSGVLVQPMTYIFDEEPARWRALLEALGKGDYVPGNGNGNGASSVSSREAAARAA